MNDALRSSLWNALDVALWSTKNYTWAQYGDPYIKEFSHALWMHHFKHPADGRPGYGSEILAKIREHFFSCEWFEVYDFLEFVVGYYKRSKPNLDEYLNRFLARELSAYRFADGLLTDITNEQELAMLEEALSDKDFPGVTGHLKRALELYSDRDNPDYRNSIKESISAVEAAARIISGKPKSTLGDALKAIDERNTLHPALKGGFLKLYGYTSDEDGVRHAMLDEPTISQADAQYFLLSCTSFVNYLKSLVAK